MKFIASVGFQFYLPLQQTQQQQVARPAKVLDLAEQTENLREHRLDEAMIAGEQVMCGGAISMNDANNVFASSLKAKASISHDREKNARAREMRKVFALFEWREFSDQFLLLPDRFLNSPRSAAYIGTQ